MDGDLLAVGYNKGWKQRDPGLQGCVLDRTPGSRDVKHHEPYRTGFYGHVTRVCADGARGLVWAAADDGRWGGAGAWLAEGGLVRLVQLDWVGVQVATAPDARG